MRLLAPGVAIRVQVVEMKAREIWRKRRVDLIILFGSLALIIITTVRGGFDHDLSDEERRVVRIILAAVERRSLALAKGRSWMTPRSTQSGGHRQRTCGGFDSQER